MLRSSIVVLLLAVAACAKPAHLVLTIEDPAGTADGFQTLTVSARAGQTQVLRPVPARFPVSATLVVNQPGLRVVRVEARDANERVLARGSTDARFARRGTPVATVVLRSACNDARDCSDGLFCTGQERCAEGTCVAGTPPCVASFPCVTSTCSELGPNDGECHVDVDHSSCATGSYCSTVAGCIPGEGCVDDSECQDGLVCNGAERCIGFRCEGGAAPDLDDANPCTLDGCNDSRTGEGQQPIFHRPDPARDGDACTLATSGDGICLAGENGCVQSTCGDAFVDVSRDEQCEDGNDNANDGCHLCRATSWAATVLSGLGYHGGVPTLASIGVTRVAVDRAGNVLVSDGQNHRIWRIDGRSGLLSLLAGRSFGGYSGDGGPAVSAEVFGPAGMAVDGGGNLFFADTYNHRVRKICGDGRGCELGHITTVAGDGTAGGLGDDGLAIVAQLNSPAGVAVDGRGNLFIADRRNHRIRRVCSDGIDCEPGTITTVVGTGVEGFSGEGELAIDAQLSGPSDVALTEEGDLIIADGGNARVRRVCGEGGACTRGIITTIAGGGTESPGDGGPATSARLSGVVGLEVDPSGNILLSDTISGRVRHVCGDARSCTVGTITTIAGGKMAGPLGDGGPATDARLSSPMSVAIDDEGNLFIGESQGSRVRRVCGDGEGCIPGHISTFAGDGVSSPLGDGLPASALSNIAVERVAVDGAGNIYLADAYNQRVRKICGDGNGCEIGTIGAFAGSGAGGDAGDGGPATEAEFLLPVGLAIDINGNVFIADNAANRIRKVCVDGDGCTVGNIETIAGTGDPGFAGDSGPAIDALLDLPAGLDFDGFGNLYVADSANYRVRRICMNDAVCELDTITTVAGNGVRGTAGDGGPAIQAQLQTCESIAVDDGGNIYIAGGLSHRVRKVCRDGEGCTVGNIDVFAGTGDAGYDGDGAAATSARLQAPFAVAVDSGRNLYIADSSNNVVRRVCGDGVGCTVGNISTFIGDGTGGLVGDGGPASSAQIYVDRVAVDPHDNVFATRSNWCIRRVCVDGVGCTPGYITSVVCRSDAPADGPLSRSNLGGPHALVALGTEWVITDAVGGRLRTLNPSTERVGTVAGYLNGFDGEGVPARYSREILDPRGIAFDESSATLFFTEYAGHTIRAIDTAASPWTVRTFAGELGSMGYAEGVGTASRWAAPAGLYLDEVARALYVADAENHVIRIIDVDTAQTSTIIGVPGTRGFFGDGGPAVTALLREPRVVAPGIDGSLYIADTGNDRVRRVDATGRIDTVLGDGTRASSGEGDPAALFPVDRPLGLAVDAWGNLFVTSSTAVRVVSAGSDGVATGEDYVRTIYGRAPREIFPEPATSCLTEVMLKEGAGGTDSTAWVLDSCAGYLVELRRQ